MKKQQKSNKISILLLFLGIAIIATGIIVNILANNALLGGLFLGYGAGIGSVTISFGIGFLIRSKMPTEKIRRQEIENKDERSIMIREKSAYYTHQVTTVSLAVSTIILSVLNIVVPLLIICGLMLLHHASYLFFLYHNGKRL